jgi:hypothetical protein
LVADLLKFGKSLVPDVLRLNIKEI